MKTRPKRRRAQRTGRLDGQFRRTREEWLRWIFAQLRPRFEKARYPLPARIHVSVGFPSKRATARRGRVIGQHWAGVTSADGAPHIFVSPVIDSGAEAAGVFAHELVHAALPIGSGHGRKFVRACDAIGLTLGKPTEAMPGAELAAVLARFISERPYPHSALDVTTLPKAQGTRLLKVECPTCGYIARVTRKWLARAGAPVCPTDGVPFVSELDDESDDEDGDT